MSESKLDAMIDAMIMERLQQRLTDSGSAVSVIDSHPMVERMRAAATQPVVVHRRNMARTVGYTLARVSKGKDKGDAVLPSIDVPERVKPVLEALIQATAVNPKARVIKWRKPADTPALTIADFMTATGRTSKQIENDVYWLRVQGVVERMALGAK